MYTLYTQSAIEQVRKNLDELDPNGSIMYTDENGSSNAYGDNASMDELILRSLPEAINAVLLAAPSALLEGKAYSTDDITSADISADGVLTIGVGETAKYLRLVEFRAADSDIVVTAEVPEASPEGRKQLNPFIRGRADSPRLVRKQGRLTGPVLVYYSLDTDNPAFAEYLESPLSAIYQFSFVQEQSYRDYITSYDVPVRLKQNIIDYLTAMVLEVYHNQAAQGFYQKAINFNLA